MKKVRFVIHNHKARRAGFHQDLRFEDPNKSDHWHSFAVPKTVPLVPNQKVLAIKTHIHSEKEALFKGDIPAGEYGGGNIELFDQGIAQLNKFTSSHIIIVMQGRKVNGLYHLISLGNISDEKFKQQNYILFKSKVNITSPLRITPKEETFYQRQIAKFNKILKKL
jgi:DNA ligase D-like protein (predicted 3'-phosphoesterase)